MPLVLKYTFIAMHVCPPHTFPVWSCTCHAVDDSINQVWRWLMLPCCATYIGFGVTAAKRRETHQRGCQEAGRIPLSGSRPCLETQTQCSSSKWRLSSEPAVGCDTKSHRSVYHKRKLLMMMFFFKCTNIKSGEVYVCVSTRVLDRNVFLHYTSAAGRCNNFPWKLGLDARFLMMESFDV